MTNERNDLIMKKIDLVNDLGVADDSDIQKETAVFEIFQTEDKIIAKVKSEHQVELEINKNRSYKVSSTALNTDQLDQYLNSNFPNSMQGLDYVLLNEFGLSTNWVFRMEKDREQNTKQTRDIKLTPSNEDIKSSKEIIVRLMHDMDQHRNPFLNLKGYQVDKKIDEDFRNLLKSIIDSNPSSNAKDVQDLLTSYDEFKLINRFYEMAKMDDVDIQMRAAKSITIEANRMGLYPGKEEQYEINAGIVETMIGTKGQSEVVKSFSEVYQSNMVTSIKNLHQGLNRIYHELFPDFNKSQIEEWCKEEDLLYKTEIIMKRIHERSTTDYLDNSVYDIPMKKFKEANQFLDDNLDLIHGRKDQKKNSTGMSMGL